MNWNSRGQSHQTRYRVDSVVQAILFWEGVKEEEAAAISQLLRHMPAIYALYIINKSGGLIYNKDLLPHSRLSINDTLRLASMWHSLCEIAYQLSPAGGQASIDLLQAGTFSLHCYQSLTGTKFLLVTDTTTPDVESLLRDTIYDLYADYVLKNPFYELEMPIKCELFDQKLLQHINVIHRRWGLFNKQS